MYAITIQFKRRFWMSLLQGAGRNWTMGHFIKYLYWVLDNFMIYFIQLNRRAPDCCQWVVSSIWFKNIIHNIISFTSLQSDFKYDIPYYIVQMFCIWNEKNFVSLHSRPLVSLLFNLFIAKNSIWITTAGSFCQEPFFSLIL